MNLWKWLEDILNLTQRTSTSPVIDSPKGTFRALDYQARCWAYGIDAGPIDDDWGPNTESAVKELMKLKGVDKKEDVFHPSGLHRIHMHWTAGAYGAIGVELGSYHILIMRDGKPVMGNLKPEANANTSDGQYAAHTRACNQGAIGVSMDCMGGAKEVPFDAGKYPMTQAQLQGMVEQVADLCKTYDIPVSRYSTLTHAEIEKTLGVWQRSKWDIKWVPGMARPANAISVGDKIRDMIRKEL